LKGFSELRLDRKAFALKLLNHHLQIASVSLPTSAAALFRAATSLMARIGQSKLLIRLTAIPRSSCCIDWADWVTTDAMR
jgi:hypothetical protein